MIMMIKTMHAYDDVGDDEDDDELDLPAARCR
jgi:hypothetical protein